jgi:hypothetical protein
VVGHGTNRAGQPPPVPLLTKEGNYLEHFDVEAAEPVPILSGRRRLVPQLTDKLAATANQSTVYI